MTTSARVRMSPESRREQLLEIGVAMLATRPLEEISIELLADEARISRGLLYHYFANKQEFHRAVVERAVSDLYEVTAPGDRTDPLDQMVASLGAYVDYVMANHAGYVSLVRAARGGDPVLREVYLSARNALTDRVFETADEEQLAAFGVSDSPALRMVARAWAALVEELVLEWVDDQSVMTRDDLLRVLAESLPAIGRRLPQA